MMTTTLVTCWWDLEKRGAEKGRRDFVALGKPVLSLPLPMVVFCDPWVADKIQDGRRGVDASTAIYASPLEELESFKRWHDRVKPCVLPENRNIPKDSHMFVAMGWSKPGMMAEVAKRNPFNTTHVGWIDLGIVHAITWEGKFPERLPQISDLSVYEHSDDSMHLHMLRCIEGAATFSEYYHKIWCLVAAGYMVGSNDKVIEFANEIEDEAERVITGGHVSIDEDLIAAVAARHPEKYKFSYGNYDNILSNHHGIKTGADYLLWMCKDARERGYIKFSEDLERKIVDAANKGDLSCPKELLPKVKTMNLIKLNMMVKNESRRIKETLESIKPWIDSWCILDTGSTDGTQDIIKKVMKGAPGELYEKPIITYEDTGIIDYAATRNLGVELAGTDAIFLLLINGDDVLQNGKALRDFCQQKANSDDEAFYLNIKDPHGLGFVYPRVVRSKAGWRYHMPTHEIICGSKPVSGQVSDAWILKCDDPDDVRFTRWEKDQKILEKYLQKNPDDHRALFYLSQTHECLSNFGNTAYRVNHLNQAIEIYSKRGKLGGWLDEAYESCMRAANLSERAQKPWADTQELFLQAHTKAPHRAEPLVRLAQHWINEGQNSLAYMFARRASEIPTPPPGPLNPDKDIYDVVIPDLLSRSAYYINQKDTGRLGAKKAAEAQPDNINLRRNYHFYSRSLRELVGSDCYIEKNLAENLQLESGWYPSTPSVCVVDNKLIVNIRTVNYKIKPDGSYDYDGTIRTRNYLLDVPIKRGPCSSGDTSCIKLTEGYGDTIHLDNYAVEMVDKTGLLRTKFPVHGFEDCRIFVWKGGLWAVCTVRDTTENGVCQQALLKIEDGDVHEIIILDGPWNGTHQKNWKPAVDGNMLRLIYSTDPLVVFENNKVHQTLAHSGRLLGSSQAIEVNGGWFWIDHEVSWNAQGRERIYAHRFVLADSNLTKVLAKSEPFFFEQLGIEFCAGIALWGNELILTYSVLDASSKLVSVPLDLVMKLLENS